MFLTCKMCFNKIFTNFYSFSKLEKENKSFEDHQYKSNIRRSDFQEKSVYYYIINMTYDMYFLKE